MPVFSIQDNTTGRKMLVDGDSPPTEQEAIELFASQPGQSQIATTEQKARFQPELVAPVSGPTPFRGITDRGFTSYATNPDEARAESEMAQQSARNMQGAMGFSDPVSATRSLPFGVRTKVAFAPTPEERKAALEMEYGTGAFVPISSNRALVRIPDGKGGHEWVIDNPVGLDAKDVAELIPELPAVITGTTAAIAAVPGPSGATAKVAQASGASALASGLTGALQDTIYRSLVGTPIDPEEIIRRRGMGATMEALAGFVLPVVGGKAMQSFKAGRSAKKFLDRFDTVANESSDALKAAGVNVKTGGDIGDAIRSLNPADASAAELGDAIGLIVTKSDDAMRENVLRQSGRALSDADRRAQAIIGASTAPAFVKPEDVGLAAIGAAKQRITDNQKMVDGLYKSAYDEIATSADASGVGKFFVKLSETKNTVDKLMGNVMRSAKQGSGGVEYEPSGAFAPLLAQLRLLENATTATQALDAARQARTMIGARARGRGEAFKDITEDHAGQIYKALSADIDNSVSAFSGTGAKALQQANAAYKGMIGVVEDSPFIEKLVNDGFASPEDVVKGLVGGNTKDWAAAKAILPPNTYAAVRRGVVGEMMGEGKRGEGGNVLMHFGREVLDVPTLNKQLSNMDAAIKTEIFGGEAPWRSLEKIGREYDFVISRGGMFSKPTLPSVDDLQGAVDIARSEGSDSSNKYIGKAIAAASARRNGMAQAFLSQARNGNLSQITQDPERFLRAVVFNGEVRPDQIRSVIKKLPADTRSKMANVAMQEIFENAREVSDSLVLKSGSYDINKMVNQVFGDRRRMEVLTDIMGTGRMDMLKNWARYEVSTAAQSGRKSVSSKRVSGLLATAPYQNLFAARAASMALETASGSHLIGALTHDKAKLFMETRRVMRKPAKTAAQIAVMQSAMNTNGFSDYTDMMSGFTPEQQDAIDSYLVRE
jgi:hypothetical protein